MLVASPCLHGCEMWHADQAPLLPSPERRVRSSSSMTPAFLQSPPNWSERRRILSEEGQGTSSFTAYLLQKVPGIGPWLLLPPSNPPKIEEGMETGLGGGLGGCPRKAAGRDYLQGRAIPGGLETLQDLQFAAGGLA